MRRREFIRLIGGVTVIVSHPAWPQQSGRMRRIGMLTGIPETNALGASRLIAFREGLAKLGWIDGRNIQIDYRADGGDSDQARTKAAELVRLSPDVILVNGATSLRALVQETRSVPTVFVNVGEQSVSNFIASVSRPGGNVTGFSMAEGAIGEKWLEILKEIAPHISRATVINSAINRPGSEAVQSAAAYHKLQLTISAASNASEFQRAIDETAREPNSGLIVLPTTVAAVHRDQIIALAAHHRLPTVYPYRYFSESGGLVSYGVDSTNLHHRAAAYVDRILKGDCPGDLPVQSPTKYEQVINLKTAKALGLNVPPALLVRADELIE